MVNIQIRIEIAFRGGRYLRVLKVASKVLVLANFLGSLVST